jgi:hypothetical protein
MAVRYYVCDVATFDNAATSNTAYDTGPTVIWISSRWEADTDSFARALEAAQRAAVEAARRVADLSLGLASAILEDTADEFEPREFHTTFPAVEHPDEFEPPGTNEAHDWPRVVLLTPTQSPCTPRPPPTACPLRGGLVRCAPSKVR